MQWHPIRSIYTPPPERKWRRNALDYEMYQSMWIPISRRDMYPHQYLIRKAETKPERYPEHVRENIWTLKCWRWNMNWYRMESANR